MVKFKEIQNQSIEELESQAENISKEIYDLTNQLRVFRKLEKSHLLTAKKRDVARVLTALRQKQLQGAENE